ncbi:MAG: Rieske 2Fe-2S domain-containing protein [Magnetococcales bacterium]|nr:Rieske 2Fe-2S domain-containing protein [Magnetococcales bacterium]
MSLPKWHTHPLAPAPGTVLCSLDELPESGGKEFHFGKGKRPFRLFVLRHAGGIRGYVNACSHFPGTPLNPNNIGNFLDTHNPEQIYCGVHGSRFDIETGGCLSGDCDGDGLEPVPVEVMEGQLVIGEGELDQA